MLDKIETGGSHLGGLVEHSEGKGEDSVVAIPRFLCGSPRLCQLRTERLVPVSKYWTYWSHAGDMSPISLLAYCWQMFGFLHYFIGWLGREIRYGPTNRTTGVLWIVLGSIFLRSSDSVQLGRWLVKGYHVWGPPVGSIRRTYMDWRRKRTCRVGWVFPYRMYIDSNRRDSWIWVTACSWLAASSNLLD
jgi:hypothetical protein